MSYLPRGTHALTNATWIDRANLLAVTNHRLNRTLADYHLRWPHTSQPMSTQPPGHVKLPFPRRSLKNPQPRLRSPVPASAAECTILRVLAPSS